MKTVHKVLITVFSFTLVISILVLLLSTMLTGSFNVGLSSSGDFNGKNISTLNPSSVATEYPLVQSDFDSIYYCMKPDGVVDFYEYNGTSVSKYAGEVKTVELKPSCTYYKIPITVYYITVEGKTLGYGLFTTKNSDADVNLYSYVFAKLIDAPGIYDLNGKMLLLSTDSSQAYNQDKTYTEVFDVNMSKGSCSAVTAQSNRNADSTGRLSERWSILTDYQLKSVSKKAAMISGRLYDESTEIYDIYDINKSVNNPFCKGAYGTFLREDSDSALIYIKKTATGFKSVRYLVEEKEIASFEGDITKDFVFSGDWVYDKLTSTFTNLITGKAIAAPKTSGRVNDFCVNDDGSLIVAVATSQSNQSLSVITADGQAENYSGNSIYTADVRNISFADSGTVITTSVQADGTCVNNIIKIK